MYRLRNTVSELENAVFISQFYGFLPFSLCWVIFSCSIPLQEMVLKMLADSRYFQRFLKQDTPIYGGENKFYSCLLQCMQHGLWSTFTERAMSCSASENFLRYRLTVLTLRLCFGKMYTQDSFQTYHSCSNPFTDLCICQIHKQR